VAELEPVFVEQVGFSLQQLLARGEPVVGIDRIQPVLVGVQLALTELWRSYGVGPDAVIGHSMGEVTAAVVSGALSVAQGLRVIATRSRLMARLSGQGAMALLELDAPATEGLIADYPDVSLAVYASPRQTVIAGPPEQVDAVMAVVDAQDRLARRIEVDVASHHPTIDPVLPELRTALADLMPQRPTIPIITTTEDQTEHGPTLFDANYWGANLRDPVRFSQAVAAAGRDYATFVEVSPHPLLTHAVSDTLDRAHHHSIGTLQRDTDDTLTFHTNLNATHATHAPHTPHPPEPHPPIPTTPWHHTQHWIKINKPIDTAATPPRPGTLLGEHISVTTTPPAHLWQARLAPEAKPYPGRHRIDGMELVPVSVLLQTLSTAASECGASILADVRFEYPLVVDHPRVIQVIADGESVTLSSRPADDSPSHRWIRHATARITQRLQDDEPAGTDVTGDHEPVSFDASSIAELQQAWGIEGQPFPWSIVSCRSGAAGLYADVGLPEASTVALLDAAVHVARLADSSNPRLMFPASVESARFAAGLAYTHGSVEVHRRGGNGDELIVDIAVKAPDGSTCVDIRSLRYADVESDPAQSAARDGDPRKLAHVIDWQPWAEHGDSHHPPDALRTLAVVGKSDAACTLRNRLAETGYTVAGLGEARYVIYLAQPDLVDETEKDIDGAVRLSAEVGDLVRCLAERDDHHPATLWIITRGVREAASDNALRQSCLWGLASVIGAEQPQLWGGLVDLSVGEDIGDCASALSTVLPTGPKSIVALRNGEFLARTIVPVSGQRVREPLRCRPDAAYLITGGMGALGLLMATWLADRGARRLVLAARTPLPPRRDWDSDTNIGDVRQKIAAIRALEMRGVSVDPVALDVGSGEAVLALLARRDADGAPPIRGVIHAAGVTDSQLLTDIADSRLRHTMWPKIGGAQALHEAFPTAGLDFFYLTASAGAIFGVPGQGAYAAANAYLDCLARTRHQRGCNTVSLDWVAWQGLGFASDAQIVVQELERLGSRPVTPDEAFAAWEHVGCYDIAQAVMVPMPSSDKVASAPSERLSRAKRTWSQMPAEKILDELESALRTILAGELGMPDAELELDRPFADLGLDSVMAMAVRREAEQLVGMELSATMLWNHPTIALLAEYLTKKLLPQQDSENDVDLVPESADSVLDVLFDSVESTAVGSESRI
jgi:phthiocerol/phenolphthiocerol synthesis type-I polyketide synthase A